MDLLTIGSPFEDSTHGVRLSVNYIKKSKNGLIYG